MEKNLRIEISGQEGASAPIEEHRVAAEAELPMVRDMLSRELRRVGRVGMRREPGRHHKEIVCADAAVFCVPGVDAPAGLS